ncbi:MAG: hypothetical protein ACRDCF_00375 [Mycoplasmoidaceae bacterium]
MRNKKLKKAVLTSLSIFAFTGVVLAANLDNISKLQTGFSNESSLNNVVKTANEISDITSYNSSTFNTATTIARNPNANSTIQTIYPFQILNNTSLLKSLILISNTPPNFDMDRDVEVSASAINNLGSTTNSGRATINVILSNYIDADGNHVQDGSTFADTVAINNFKSVTSQTTYDKNSVFNPSNHYASDVEINSSDPSKIDITNVLEVKNGVSSVSINTIAEPLSLSFNNNAGSLTVSYTLTHWFDQSGTYFSSKTPARSVNVIGFKIVDGPTFLDLKEGINGSTLIPSTIAGRLEENFASYKEWFELKNLPNDSIPEPITAIKNVSANDKDGKISFTYTISGSYFDNNLVPQIAAELDVDTVIEGLNSEVEKVDIIPIVVGASVGGIALIAAIALTIFFVSRAKKKKSENLRKQKLSEKVSPPTGSVSKTTTSTPSSMSSSVPGGTKPPVGPPTPGNRPVPPPARK